MLVSEKPVPIAVGMVCAFYEQLGYLLSRNLIELDTILNLFTIKRPWEKVKPIVEGFRKQ